MELNTIIHSFICKLYGAKRHHLESESTICDNESDDDDYGDDDEYYEDKVKGKHRKTF